MTWDLSSTRSRFCFSECCLLFWLTIKGSLLISQVAWYNERVAPVFHIPHHPDTLAVLVISTPGMFEALFKPYLLRCHASQQQEEGNIDPLDNCMKVQFDRMRYLFPEQDIYYVQDFELMLPSRRPKILVQTAGHVAGAAYYYQPTDVSNPSWDPNKKMYGVSVHPKYGGWFAFRGVLVFKDVQVAGLSQREPVDCVHSEERRVELLDEFNFHWQEWDYRNVLDTPVQECYSEQQKLYFGTHPSERKHLVAEWVATEQCSGAF